MMEMDKVLDINIFIHRKRECKLNCVKFSFVVSE